MKQVSDSLPLIAQIVCQQHWVTNLEGDLVCRCEDRLLRALWCLRTNNILNWTAL